MNPLLAINGLSVTFHGREGATQVTHQVSFEVMPGETVALVGESGSGKSVTAMSILNLLPKTATRAGSIRFENEELVEASDSQLRKIRGRDISMIFQEPMTALNPVYTIGQQLIEAILSHRNISRSESRQRAIRLLRQVRMPDPELRFGMYPHQLSGGQRQRAMIAIAISAEPKLLIADEPTTALDVTVQAEILDLLVELKERLDMSLLIITHDMGIVAEVAERVVVMRSGKVVESATSASVFYNPRSEYTRELLAAVPRMSMCEQQEHHSPSLTSESRQSEVADRSSPLISVSNLVVQYGGFGRRKGVSAVRDVSFDISRGEVLGLVGESGSGKSTIARALVGLVRPTSGAIVIAGSDIATLSRGRMRRLRRGISMVFQDPVSSLDPRVTVGDSIIAPLRWHGLERTHRKLEAKKRELLDSVKIPTAWASRYPHELSGGQRQRVGIARALSLDPALMVVDEPTSALDVSVQARVLELLSELQASLGFACLFISHDLSVIEQLSHRVLVLNKGKVAEGGETHQVLHHPVENYTKLLVAAVPVPDPELQAIRRLDRQRYVQ